MALPGVQVLFAFLLVVPFNTRFAALTAAQERLYLATLLCAGLASALLIAPGAQHRILFRLQDKHHLVLVSNRLTIVGLGFLALAMTGAIALVTDVVFTGAVTGVVTALIGSVFLGLWYLLPLRRRLAMSRDLDDRQA